jgi:hypothetical protein
MEKVQIKKLAKKLETTPSVSPELTKAVIQFAQDLGELKGVVMGFDAKLTTISEDHETRLRKVEGRIGKVAAVGSFIALLAGMLGREIMALAKTVFSR